MRLMHKGDHFARPKRVRRRWVFACHSGQLRPKWSVLKKDCAPVTAHESDPKAITQSEMGGNEEGIQRKAIGGDE